MNRFNLLRLVIASAIACIAAPAFAQQQQAPTANKGQLGVTLGYGVNVGDGDVNPYGLGLGVRGGYTLDMNVYVGGFFNYFLGESEETPIGDISVNYMTLGGEVGYDIGLDTVVIRPSLGIGLIIASASIGDESESDEAFLLAPGANVVVPLDGFYVGGELRYYWLPSEDGGDGLLIAANVGVLL